MSKVKFSLNKARVGALLKGSEIQAIISKQGERIASAAGKGYESKTVVRQTRAVTTVTPDTVAAHFDNLKNNTLLRAMGGGK